MPPSSDDSSSGSSGQQDAAPPPRAKAKQTAVVLSSSGSGTDAESLDGDDSEEEAAGGQAKPGSEESGGEKDKKKKRKEPESGSEDDDKKQKKKKAKKAKSSSGSESSNESEDKKKKQKDKKGGKEKEKGKEKGKEKDKKGKKAKGDKKDKKKPKKDKKAKGKKMSKKAKTKDKASRDAVSQQFGKYGVIKSEDFFNKKPEFLLWALEVKKENTDAMGQMQMKDLFKEYIEDYNTATMPSKKYYNLQAWDKQMTAKRSKKVRGDGMTEAQRKSLASFDDERARREEIKHMQAKKQDQQITDEVRKMRMDRGKVEEMKHQAGLRVQLEMLNKTGNTKLADKIKDRLDPGKDEFGRPVDPFRKDRLG